MFAADWGTIPDWVAAVGTSGGLLFVAYQSFLTRKEFGQMSADRELGRRAERGRSSQHVSVATSVHEAPDGSILIRYNVRNDAAAEVSQVCVVHVEPHASSPPSLENARFKHSVPDLPGFQSYMFSAVGLDASIEFRQALVGHEDELGAIYFTDANGHTWLRWGNKPPEHIGAY